MFYTKVIVLIYLKHSNSFMYTTVVRVKRQENAKENVHMIDPTLTQYIMVYIKA